MDDLAAYLAGDYPTERRRREDAAGRAAQIVAGIARHHSDGRWPYLLEHQRNGDPQPVGSSYSFSTNAMILHSLAAAAGPLRSSVYVSAGEGRLVADLTSRDGAPVLDALRRGLSALRTELEAMGKPLTKSATYGKDDPLTCGLLLELDRFTVDKRREGPSAPELPTLPSDLRAKIWRQTQNKITAVLERGAAVFARRGLGRQATLGDHAFPILCLMRMAEALSGWTEVHGKAGSLDDVLAEARQQRADAVKGLDELIKRLRQSLRPVFQNLLFQQLAHATIPTGEFDAAELALSLEGLLMCGDPPHRDLVGSVFDTLQAKQAENPYWRPSKPFQTSPEGRVLLPVSIEVANSLLRTCYLLDTDHDPDALFDRYLSLFHAYWKWLLSRWTRGTTAQGEFFGWSSEHAGREGMIHLWETSQVLLFLVQYSGMLRRHMGRRTLLASRLPSKMPRRNPSGHDRSAVDYWDSKFLEREPLRGVGEDSPYRIYTRIREDYIRPHDTPPGSLPRPYSMLLYGPPGTGKSALAEAIAETLGRRLITVTTSDFLAGGPGEVEGRAKDLFEALPWQHATVILFDEIDHFLLDRESYLYRQQTGIFQFMTPGMLTKIKDLRDSKRPIFLIATNYRERIDRAIRRKGRVDKEMILLPPDSSQRVDILTKEYKKELEREGLAPKELAIAFTAEQRRDLVEKTRLWVFGELLELVNAAANEVKRDPEPNDVAAALVRALATVSPALTLRAYEARFNLDRRDDFPTNEEPFEEFYLLVYLACERKALDAEPAPLTDGDRDLVGRVVLRQRSLHQTEGEEIVDQKLRTILRPILSECCR